MTSRALHTPSPQTVAQSVGHDARDSVSAHRPSPHPAAPQSPGHEPASSARSHTPSPQLRAQPRQRVQSPGQPAGVSPGSHRPSPQRTSQSGAASPASASSRAPQTPSPAAPQSTGQLVKSLPESQTPLPQPSGPQSAGQTSGPSPASQTPLPHARCAQSAGQLSGLSPGLQTSSPQGRPQSRAHATGLSPHPKPMQTPSPHPPDRTPGAERQQSRAQTSGPSPASHARLPHVAWAAASGAVTTNAATNKPPRAYDNGARIRRACGPSHPAVKVAVTPRTRPAAQNRERPQSGKYGRSSRISALPTSTPRWRRFVANDSPPRSRAGASRRARRRATASGRRTAVGRARRSRRHAAGVHAGAGTGPFGLSAARARR